MPTPPKQRPPHLRYHAVSIVSEPNACAQAQAVKDVRLLSAEAPRLPLVGCSSPDGCRCRFQHHDDRRAGPRRAGQRSVQHDILTSGDNRRRLPGRRATDDLGN